MYFSSLNNIQDKCDLYNNLNKYVRTTNKVLKKKTLSKKSRQIDFTHNNEMSGLNGELETRYVNICSS